MQSGIHAALSLRARFIYDFTSAMDTIYDVCHVMLRRKFLHLVDVSAVENNIYLTSILQLNYT